MGTFGRVPKSTSGQGTSPHASSRQRLTPYLPSAFRSRALMEETRPQFEQVIWYDRDVVNTGMKNSENFRARSSRCCCTNCPQFRQVAGRPGKARMTVLRPKMKSMKFPFQGSRARQRTFRAYRQSEVPLVIPPVPQPGKDDGEHRRRGEAQQAGG